MPVRLTGLNSGLDTEALVSELVSAYRTKTQKYTKAQTKLTWKQSAWSALNTKINNFYKSVGNLRFTSAYKMKKASVSDATKASVSVSSAAVNGTQTLEITQTAKAGYLTGAKLGKGTNGSTKLSDLGITEDSTISVTAGGKTSNIKINGETTINGLVESLNSAGVKASFDATNHRFFISAKDTGKDSDFSLTAADSKGMDALTKLGVNVSSAANTESYELFAAYARNTSGGAYFVKTDNGDGTFSYTTNGTYDSTATENYITSLRQQMADKSQENTTLTANIGYANAYKGVEDVHKKFTTENGGTEAEWELFQKLLNRSDLNTTYTDESGTSYSIKDNGDGTYTATYTDASGTEQSASVTKNGDKYTMADGTELTHAAVRHAELAVKAGLATHTVDDDGSDSYNLDGAAIGTLRNNLAVKKEYEDEVQEGLDAGTQAGADNKATMDAIKAAYEGTSADGKSIDDLTKEWSQTISANKAFIDEHAAIADDTQSPSFLASKAEASAEALLNPSVSNGAVRVDGQDATILLNGAEFTSSTNQFDINGLTINALAKTDGEITITTDDDVTGLYDKIKDFLTSYNALINEMTALYNAPSAKGYEPLTDEEKSAMSDAEVEKWESKIKDSILRRDDTLNGIINLMTTSMSRSYTVDGKRCSLASFGIQTLGIFDSAVNQQNAYHINGDEDDASSSAKQDKLMAALKSDPDSVVEFMRQLADGLYKSLDKKMTSNQMRSKYTVYNDKEMASEYSDYTDTITKWEEKLQKMEDSYYKKFSAMETALAKLQSQQSQLSGLLGM